MSDGTAQFDINFKMDDIDLRMKKVEEELRSVAGTAEQTETRTTKAVRNVARQTQESAGGMEGALKKASSAFLGFMTIDAGFKLIQSIISVRSEFEKYEAVLTTSYGSHQKATEAMTMLTDIASKTPFQLTELTASFVKLKNQGFEPTRAEIIKLGDLASSTGKGFDQLVEAILDAQTGEFERLKEFGIKASQNGDKVTFTFKEQKTTVDNTAKSIRAYMLSLGDLQGVQGSMSSISETLGGQISNLGDSWDKLLNSIGKSGEGSAKGGVSFLASITDGLTLMINKFNAIKDNDYLSLFQKIGGLAIIPYGSDLVDSANKMDKNAESGANAYMDRIKSQLANFKGQADAVKLANTTISNNIDAVILELNKVEKIGGGKLSNLSPALQQYHLKLTKELSDLRDLSKDSKGIGEIVLGKDKGDEALGILEKLRKELKGLQDDKEKATNKKQLIQLEEETVKVEKLIFYYENLSKLQRADAPGKIVAINTVKLTTTKVDDPAKGFDYLDAQLNARRVKSLQDAQEQVDKIREDNKSKYKKMLDDLDNLDTIYQKTGRKKDEAYYKEKGKIISDYAHQVANVISEIGNNLSSVDPQLGEAINGISSLASAAGSIAEGNYAAALTSIMSVGTAIADITTSTFNWSKEQESLNKNLNDTLKLFSDLGNNKGMSYFTEYSKTIGEGNKSIEADKNKIAEYQKQIDDWKKKAKPDVWKALFGAVGIAEDVAEYKKAQSEISKLNEAIKLSEANIERIKQEQAAAEATFKENLTGTTTSSIADSIVEGFKKGQSASEIFANNFENIMLNAVSGIFERKVWDQLMQAGGFNDMLTSAMSDLKLTKEEKDALAAKYKTDLSGLETMWKDVSSIISIPGQDAASQSQLTGGIKGIQEDTANVMAGTLNALRITALEQRTIAMDSYNQFVRIELNTRQTAGTLIEMRDLMKGNSNNQLITDRANGV